MTMQRRHFQFIADTIKSISDKTQRLDTATRFAEELKSTNANFDKARFMTACGI